MYTIPNWKREYNCKKYDVISNNRIEKWKYIKFLLRTIKLFQV